MAWQKSKTEFERIMNLYGNDVYRLAMVKVRNTEDAKDIYQNVFLRFFHSDHNFESDAHIKAWLLKVTANASIDFLRSIWHTKVGVLDKEIPYMDEDDRWIWNEVGKLPAKFRVAVHLFYYEGYSTEEIAEIMGEKPVTIRSRLNRARKMLKERLGDIYVSE